MRRKRLRRTLAAVLALLLLGTGALLALERAIRPVLGGLSETQVEAKALAAMQEAILDTLPNGDGGALLRVYAQDGRAYLLETDSARLNRLCADCALAAQERIRRLGEQGVSVPLGTAIGLSFLNGIGPKIKVRFTPDGTVHAACESRFTSAGINQTVHRVTLKLTATVRIVLPGGARTVTVTTETPVSEDVIIGDVPDTYADMNDADEFMNLIP